MPDDCQRSLLGSISRSLFGLFAHLGRERPVNYLDILGDEYMAVSMENINTPARVKLRNGKIAVMFEKMPMTVSVSKDTIFFKGVVCDAAFTRGTWHEDGRLGNLFPADIPSGGYSRDDFAVTEIDFSGPGAPPITPPGNEFMKWMLEKISVQIDADVIKMRSAWQTLLNNGMPEHKVRDIMDQLYNFGYAEAGRQMRESRAIVRDLREEDDDYVF